MTRQKDSPAPPEVELWYSCRGGATTTALAVGNGWLQQEFAGGGTVLRSLSDAASRDIRLSHYHHGQSGLLREGSNVPAIWARSAGQQAVVVGITWVDEFQGIFSLAGGKVRELADLKGKRLGLPLRRHALIDLQRAGAQRGLSNALELAGLPPRLARWTHIESPDFEYPQRSSGRQIEIEALLSGYADAVFLRGAQGHAAARDPRLHLVADLNLQSDPVRRANLGTPRTITVDRAFLAHQPDIVARYLSVLQRTAAWAVDQPRAVLELTAQESGGYDIGDVAGAHGPALHRSFAPGLAEVQVDALRAQKEFLLEYDFLKADFDVADWIVAEPLRQAAELTRQLTRLHAAPPATTPFTLLTTPPSRSIHPKEMYHAS